MRTQSLSANEQYWRDRYGMPPRAEEISPVRRRRRSSRATRWRRLKTGAARRRATFRWRFDFGLPGRSVLLKLSAALLLAVWLAGGATVFLNGLPADVPTVQVSRVLPILADTSPDMPGTTAPKSYDAIMADFTGANEASLVALRGLILTGSEGFRSEWRRSLARLDATQAAIVADSRGWTDGGRLLQLAELRRVSADLVLQQQTLAGLVGTPNRYPGLRLHDEDVDPALADAVRLCDEALQSVMASKWAGTARSIDTLAQLRGNLRHLREGLAAYLHSAERTMPPDLRRAHIAFREAAATLAGIRGRVSPDDQTRLDRLAALLATSDGQLERVLALKQTPRWDYADYAFRQKALPLAERISAIVAEWRAAS